MRKTFIGVFLAVMVAVASIYAMNIPLSRGVGSLLHPVGGWLYGLGGDIRQSVSSLPSRMSSELDGDARREITDLRLQLIEQEYIRIQNQELRSELGFVDDYEIQNIPADIVNYQPDDSRDMIRIRFSSDENVISGLPVVSRGVLLGVIDGVEGSYAKVILKSDIDFRALVEVEGVSGVLSGQVGRELLVESLPRNRGIGPGSLVFTSGRDGVYPPGLLIGSVHDISQTQGGVFDRAQVTPELLARDLQTVTILKP